MVTSIGTKTSLKEFVRPVLFKYFNTPSELQKKCPKGTQKACKCRLVKLLFSLRNDRRKRTFL